jgi:hypothetical protein
MTLITANHKQPKRMCLAMQRMHKALKSGENGVINFGRMAE